MSDQKIYFKKVRDLSGIFSASFGFIKQNFKPLFGSVLLYAGPLLLLTNIISSYYFSGTYGTSRFLNRGDNMEMVGTIIVALLFTSLFAFIGITIYNVVVNRIILENEKLNSGERLTVKHAAINFWPDFWRMLGNIFLLGLILIVALTVIVLVFAGVFALVGADGGASAAIMVILGVLLMLLVFLIFGPILMFIPIAAMFICQRDGIPIFSAIGKVFYYMKNNFWATWAVNFVGLLTYTMLNLVAQIPVFIITLISTLSRARDLSTASDPSVLIISVTSICALLSYCVMTSYHLIAVYQFTSLEEKKEGSGILQTINEIQ